MASLRFMLLVVCVLSISPLASAKQEIEIVGDDVHITSEAGNVIFNLNDGTTSAMEIKTAHDRVDMVEKKATSINNTLMGVKGTVEGRAEELKGFADDIKNLQTALGDVTYGDTKAEDAATQMKAIMDLVTNISGKVDTLQQDMDVVKGNITTLSQQIADIKTMHIDPLHEDLSALQNNVSTVSDAAETNSREVVRIEDALDLLYESANENLEEVTVYGPWVVGDDIPSPVSCPVGTKPVSCLWEAPETDTDGVVLDTIHRQSDYDCIVYARAHVDVKIRAALKCSNLYTDAVSVLGPFNSKEANQKITCPDDFMLTDCHCHSFFYGCDETKLQKSSDKKSCTYTGTPARPISVTGFCAKIEGYRSVRIQGPVVQANDARSAVVCPEPLKLTACDVHVYAGRSDGIVVGASGGACAAFGYYTDPIRAEATCSNYFSETKGIQGDQEQTVVRNVTCDDGYTAIECYCHSPWGLCYQNVYEPVDNTTCSFKTREPTSYYWARPSVLCAKN